LVTAGHDRLTWPAPPVALGVPGAAGSVQPPLTVMLTAVEVPMAFRLSMALTVSE